MADETQQDPQQDVNQQTAQADPRIAELEKENTELAASLKATQDACQKLTAQLAAARAAGDLLADGAASANERAAAAEAKAQQYDDARANAGQTTGFLAHLMGVVSASTHSGTREMITDAHDTLISVIDQLKSVRQNFSAEYQKTLEHIESLL